MIAQINEIENWIEIRSPLLWRQP